MSGIKIWISKRLFATDLFLNFKENKLIVARNLNYVAFAVAFTHSTYLLVSGIMTMTFLGVFTCYIVSFLCIVTEIIFKKNKLNEGLIFTFVTTPVALVVKGFYEPMPGLMLFPLAYGIVCIFLLPKARLIYPVFGICVMCFVDIDVACQYKYNPNFSKEISLLLFNNFLFAFLIYTVLGYLRNLLSDYQTQNRLKEYELSEQNKQLQLQQEEIANQNILLQQRNQLLIESWHFQQRLTSVLSHDLRSSLIFLGHAISAYKKQKTGDEGTMDFISELDAEIKNMNILFEEVLQWLKQPTAQADAKKEMIHMYDIAEEINFMYMGAAKGKNLLLINKIEQQQQVYANPEYIKVILRNLVGNSLKFTPKNGHIILSGSVKDNMYHLNVEDNGIGITAANLIKIKEGIELSTNGTQKETGIGLGLVFCRDFVKRSDGFISIHSVYGKGTVLTVALPLKSLCDKDRSMKTPTEVSYYES